MSDKCENSGCGMWGEACVNSCYGIGSVFHGEEYLRCTRFTTNPAVSIPAAELTALNDEVLELEKQNMSLLVDSFDYVPTKTHMRLVRKYKEVEVDRDRIDGLGRLLDAGDDINITPCGSDILIDLFSGPQFLGKDLRNAIDSAIEGK